MAHHRRLTFLLSAPHTQSLQGFTLIEAMVTIAMVGVLAAIAAPNVTRLGSKPLPDTANQVAGVFRAARTRAMAQTSPIKVRPLGNVALANGKSDGGSNTQLEVLRSTSTNTVCNAANLPPLTPRFVYLRQERFSRDYTRTSFLPLSSPFASFFPTNFVATLPTFTGGRFLF
jgi:prepilin-type N-terminal cleavage/methylation domain-containing protein